MRALVRISLRKPGGILVKSTSNFARSDASILFRNCRSREGLSGLDKESVSRGVGVGVARGVDVREDTTIMRSASRSYVCFCVCGGEITALLNDKVL
jgi:hypothetical protein